jgi:hypothetical protein
MANHGHQPQLALWLLQRDATVVTCRRDSQVGVL